MSSCKFERIKVWKIQDIVYTVYFQRTEGERERERGMCLTVDWGLLNCDSYTKLSIMVHKRHVISRIVESRWRTGVTEKMADKPHINCFHAEINPKVCFVIFQLWKKNWSSNVICFANCILPPSTQVLIKFSLNQIFDRYSHLRNWIWTLRESTVPKYGTKVSIWCSLINVQLSLWFRLSSVEAL